MNLDERCDGKLNCKDRSDEEECKVFVTFKGYNKFLAPPGSSNDLKFSLNLSILIHKIIEIDEVGGYFKTKLTSIRMWKNPQLTYHNLKRNPASNAISSEDMKKMWKPWFVFDNIEQKNDLDRTDAPDRIMIIPNEEYNFQMDDKTNFRNTRVFKGEENIIYYQLERTVKWVCDFDMRWYPFDVQKCTIKMHTLKSTVTVIPSSVEYLGPEELTLHTIRSVTICSATIKGLSGIVVEVVLGRPIFGTTLTVFMPTCILLVLSQMVRVFGEEHLEMVIDVNLTLLLVLATL